ncbi:MAG: hypothetical protein RLZZ31_1785 [Actinomycetota bacterium]
MPVRAITANGHFVLISRVSEKWEWIRVVIVHQAIPVMETSPRRE